MSSIHQRLREAEQHLAAVDPVMAEQIEVHGPCRLASRRRDPFQVLCSSIISQQLSSRAADTIQARLMQGLGASDALAPGHLLAAGHEQLRTFGLSNAKARWLRQIAEEADSGRLDFRQLRKMDDESAIARLDALPGIGRWTAEMFLIFAMHRLDLFAEDDIGLQRGLKLLYGAGRELGLRRRQTIIRRWAPYRSVASWYLWRVADPVTQTWS